MALRLQMIAVTLLLLTGCGKFGFVSFSKKDRSLRTAANLPNYIEIVGSDRVFPAGSCAAFDLVIGESERVPVKAKEDYSFEVRVVDTDGSDWDGMFLNSNCSSRSSEHVLSKGASSARFYIRHSRAEVVTLKLSMQGVEVGDWAIRIIAKGANVVTFGGTHEVNAGECSSLEIQVQDSLGNLTVSNPGGGSPRVIELSGVERGGFYSDSRCQDEIGSESLAANARTKLVYVRAEKSGTHYLKAETDGLRSEAYALNVRPGAPTQLVVQGPSLFPKLFCSDAFTLKRLDAFGNPAPAPIATVVNLEAQVEGGGSPSASFHAAGDCGNAVSSVTIQPDSASTEFYVTDSRTEVLNLIAQSGDFAPTGMVVQVIGAGSPDPSFGVNGKQMLTGISGNAIGRSVAVQPDGKIVVGGMRTESGNTDFVLARLLPDGNLDSSFGNNGVAVTDLSRLDLLAQVYPLPDGRIIVVGSTGVAGEKNLVVLCYLVTGALDTSFGGGDGMVTPNRPGEDGGNAITRLTNGHLVAAGYAKVGGRNRFYLSRFSPVGAVVSDYGTPTTVETSNTNHAVASAIVSDGSDNVYVGGYFETVTAGSVGGRHKNFALVKFDSTGSRLANWGSNGVATLDFGMRDHAAIHSLVLSEAFSHPQTSNPVPAGIVVGGHYRQQNVDHSVVAKFRQSNGQIENTFGELVGQGPERTGALALPFGIRSNSHIRSLAKTADNRILFTGAAFRSSTGNDIASGRITALGDPDTTYGSLGKLATDEVKLADQGFGVALQQDSIIVGGYVTDQNANRRIVVYRLRP